jgi:uncharacterized protein YycO
MHIQRAYKVFVICLCFSTLVHGAELATDNSATADANLVVASQANQLEKDGLKVMAFIENSQRLRALLPTFVDESNQAIAQHNGALPATYALRLARSLAKANEIRDGLFDQALRHRGALYRVDNQLADSDRMAEIVIGMAAAITLYDNNKAMREAFDNNALLSSKLNESYPELSINAGFYNSSNMRAANPEYRKAMNDAVQYFNDNKPAIEAELSQSASPIPTLYAYVAQSPYLLKQTGSNVFKEIVILPVKAAKGMLGLSGRSLGGIKFSTSQVVGNTVGLVRWRNGKLKDDAAMLKTLQAQLQPGDILLEKTPFALTDKSIPGHFGHAAIYTGTANQLRDLGAFTLPQKNLAMVQKNLAKIEAGHVVVEALRNGVQLDTLEDFMNIDDIAILRPKYVSPEARIEAVNLALGNLGKKYDFNFDVNTTETIVCSELVYIVYPQIDFVTKRVLGSFAITPDDIAVQAGGDNDPLELILFGHDGKLVFNNQGEADGLALYNSLVKSNVPETIQNQQPQQASFKGFIQ